jgi:hypothetical protein
MPTWIHPNDHSPSTLHSLLEQCWTFCSCNNNPRDHILQLLLLTIPQAHYTLFLNNAEHFAVVTIILETRDHILQLLLLTQTFSFMWASDPWSQSRNHRAPNLPRSQKCPTQSNIVKDADPEWLAEIEIEDWRWKRRF